MKPIPLHHLTPAALFSVLEGLHRARRGRPLYVTYRFSRTILHAWWGSHRLVPDALWRDGETPQGRTCPWPRVRFRGTAKLYARAVLDGHVDHEAIAWAYEQDDAWWRREGWKEVCDARV